MDIKEEARIRTRLLCPSGEPLSVEQQDKLMPRNRVTYLEKVKNLDGPCSVISQIFREIL